MPLFGPPTIEKLKAKGDVKALIKALKYDDCKLVSAVASLLGDYNDPRAVEPLIAILQEKKWDDATNQVNCTRLVREKDTVSPRATAAQSLGKLRDARAVPALKAVALELFQSDEVWMAAILSLNHIDPEQIATLTDYLGRYLDPASMPALEIDRAVKIRIRIMEVLGEMSNRHTLPLLVSALANPDSGVRSRAAAGLKSLNWQPADIDQRIWFWIADRQWNELSRLGAQAVSPLIHIAAFDEFKGASMVDYFHGEQEMRIREAAFKAVLDMQSIAIKPLEEILSKSNDPMVRYQVFQALFKIKDTPIELLFIALKDKNFSDRYSAAVVIGRRKDPRAIPHLIEAMNDPDYPVRSAAENVLKEMGWMP